MQQYPSWRYHRTLEAVIVESPEEDDALGEGWEDTPAAFLADEGEPCSSLKTTSVTKKKRE